MLSMGQPRRHHLVIYLHLALEAPYTAEAMSKLLKPDPREVAVCAWLTRQHAAAITAVDEESIGTVTDIPEAPPVIQSVALSFFCQISQYLYGILFIGVYLGSHTTLIICIEHGVFVLLFCNIVNIICVHPRFTSSQ